MNPTTSADLASARERPARRLDAPALDSIGWVPEGLWPELDELRADHLRLLAQRDDVGSDRSTLEDKFKGEDAERQHEQTAAYREGREPNPTSVTPPGEREAQLTAADERSRAASAALDGFVNDAIALIEKHAPVWVSDLSSQRSAAEAKRQEAARLLAEAKAEETRVMRVEHWVTSNAGTSLRPSSRAIPSRRFVAWDFIEESWTPPPPLPEPGAAPIVNDPPVIPPWDGERRGKVARQVNESVRRSLAPGHKFANPADAPITIEEEQS